MMPPSGPLVDQFGRRVRKLRISVTDHCNFRCIYCMDEQVQFLPTAEFLTFMEIERVVRIVAAMGVVKVRLTGGEPLLRPGLPRLVERLRAVPGIRSVSLTTNGFFLARYARDLKEAGLSGVNVSLDTLDPQRFRQIARRGDLKQVLHGIEAAVSTGLLPLKINCVVMRGINDGEIETLLRWSFAQQCQVRFIEFMPLDASNIWERDLVYTKEEILAVARRLGPFHPADNDPAEPARLYQFAGGRGVFGVIPSVSEPFCRTCDRIRLTADGKIRNCLFALEELDLRPLLRNGAGDAEIAGAIRSAVWQKWAGHTINMPGFQKPQRTMHAIGG